MFAIFISLFFIGCMFMTFSVIGLLFRVFLLPIQLAIVLFSSLLLIPFVVFPLIAMPLLFFLIPLKMVLIGVGIGYLIARRKSRKAASWS